MEAVRPVRLLRAEGSPHVSPLHCRDQLYFCNISLFILDEAMAGFYLDGKFMEPRSDDTLHKLAKNLEKQQAGSITRHIESEMVFLGTDLHASYAVKKGYLRDAELSPSSAAQVQQLLQTLKRALETSPAVRLSQVHVSQGNPVSACVGGGEGEGVACLRVCLWLHASQHGRQA